MRSTERWSGFSGRAKNLGVFAAGVVVVALAGSEAKAQCGAGGNFSGACVNLEFRPPLQSVFVGDTMELGLYAVSVNAFDQPIQALDILLSWDPASLELRGHKTCKGGANNGAVCVSSTECGVGVTCSLDCEAGQTPNCYSCPADGSYNWLSVSYPNDEQLDGLNADCGPGIFCNPFTGRPFNDGEARLSTFKQVLCNGLPAPPPLATEAGLLIATVRFRVLTPGPSLVAFKAMADCQTLQRTCAVSGLPCTVDTDCGTRVCSGGTNPGSPCTSNLQCPPDGFCPVLCKACEPQACCTTDANCSMCSFADTRVLGGTTIGFDVTGALGLPAQIDASDCRAPTVTALGPRYLGVTPAAGAVPVGLKVTGVEADVACVSGWVQANGNVLATPFFQLPSAWGTTSVRAADLVSNRTYQVETSCNAVSPDLSLSLPASATLWARGDVDNNNVVDIGDIVRVLDGFRQVLDSLTPCVLDGGACVLVAPNFACNVLTGFCKRVTLENVDLIGGGGCAPDTVIDIVDIVQVLNAFGNLTDQCPPPCVP